MSGDGIVWDGPGLPPAGWLGTASNEGLRATALRSLDELESAAASTMEEIREHLQVRVLVLAEIARRRLEGKWHANDSALVCLRDEEEAIMSLIGWLDGTEPVLLRTPRQKVLLARALGKVLENSARWLEYARNAGGGVET